MHIKGGIMNNLIISLLSLLVFCSSLIAGDMLSLEEAKVLAAETNKPLLLDFFTEW